MENPKYTIGDQVFLSVNRKPIKAIVTSLVLFCGTYIYKLKSYKSHHITSEKGLFASKQEFLNSLKIN